ncbi:gamma subclass chorismate mutase AroQ [Paraherbaspirillum soli]|uniref:chorismate mutase n=1 Tax=Paraherbaspirillum soli TaxID=631222 RepID=A0ABW0MC41_9BURK
MYRHKLCVALLSVAFIELVSAADISVTPTSVKDGKTPLTAPATINLEPLRRLMDERLSLMPDVARYKWNTKSAIDDLPREQKIIDGLTAKALALGVPAAWAEQFFRAQIEAAKVIQREHFARWEKAGMGSFADVPDLGAEIRPRLDALTSQLLRELAVAWPALADPAQRDRIATTMQGMLSVSISREAAALAAVPLIDGSASMLAPNNDLPRTATENGEKN